MAVNGRIPVMEGQNTNNQSVPVVLSTEQGGTLLDTYITLEFIRNVIVSPQSSEPTAITVDTTPAYSINDVIGGILTIPLAIPNTSTAKLVNLCVKEFGGLTPELLLVLFDDSGSLTGTYTNNSAAVFTLADSQKIAAAISVKTTDYVATNSVAIASFNNLNLMVATDVLDARMVLLAKSAYNPGTTTQLSIQTGWQYY